MGFLYFKSSHIESWQNFLFTHQLQFMHNMKKSGCQNRWKRTNGWLTNIKGKSVEKRNDYGLLAWGTMGRELQAAVVHTKHTEGFFFSWKRSHCLHDTVQTRFAPMLSKCSRKIKEGTKMTDKSCCCLQNSSVILFSCFTQFSSDWLNPQDWFLSSPECLTRCKFGLQILIWSFE